ncbi:MAG: ATP-dependent zinc metalloprotease FtsH [Clostridia bacterium]|nr:ATP-dependent zinc metalloprotease FtsH [Clostridia bacterium]
MNKNDKLKMPLGVVMFLALPVIIVLFYIFTRGFAPEKTYNYSEIVDSFKNEQVTKYSMNLGSGEMEITLKDGNVLYYTAPSTNLMYADIKDYIEKYNENNPDAPMEYNLIKAKDTSGIISIVSFIVLPILTMLFLGWLFTRRMTSLGMGPGGAMSMGKSKAVVTTEKKVTFEDVAGARSEKEELYEIVDFLRNPEKYRAVGAKIPRGVILMGPPGTGKTLLAKAVAGEAGVPFFSTSGSDFIEMYVGLGAARVRDLFEQAKKQVPCIIFIDEIDAVGRRRDSGINGAEKDNTLNQLLVEMDGFNERDDIIIMAATNRPDVLDSALMRPGRFDRQIYVNYPDIKEREEILMVHTKGKPFGPDVKLKTIAKSTAGFTGADLANLINEAAILTVRNNIKAITMKEIEEATLKVTIGLEKKKHVVTPEDKKLTAYHEGGHAIVSYFCKNHDKVHEISIIPRGNAGGYTRYLPEKDDIFASKTKLTEEIKTLVGGMVSEKLICNDTTTGVASDLKRATKIARDMVAKYGMDDEVGPVVYFANYDYLNEDIGKGIFQNCSTATASKIDEQVKNIISGACLAAKTVLTQNIDKLHEIANYLIENEKMSGEKFEEIMSGKCKEDNNSEDLSSEADK